MGQYLLVHGGMCGGWVWDDVAERLRAAGHDAHVVAQLPSGGTDPATLGGLDDDAAHVRRMLDDVGSVVLVGHSYGGIVLAELGADPRVRHSVYLTAMWPQRGQSACDMFGGTLPDVLTWTSGHAIQVTDDFEAAWNGFAPDLGRADAERMVSQLVLQSGASFTSPSTAPDRTHPTTYVIAELESAGGLAAQEAWSTNADEMVRIPAAHMAMMSQPDAVVDALCGVE